MAEDVLETFLNEKRLKEIKESTKYYYYIPTGRTWSTSATTWNYR